MKNYLDLLATDLQLNITVNGDHCVAGLYDTLTFNKDDTVIIDGIEILPYYRYLVDNESLKINEPFYQWYHRVSAQGWLLKPQ